MFFAGAERQKLSMIQNKKRPTKILLSYTIIYWIGIFIILLSCIATLQLAILKNLDWLFPIAFIPVILLIYFVYRRLLEFKRFEHIPGPKPNFFLGNLNAILSQEHSGRDQALINLHEVYGSIVKLHLGWGSIPFVSVAYPSNLIRGKVDSNRKADRTILGKSLMGMKAGVDHIEHRNKLNPHFSYNAVRSAYTRLNKISSAYIEAWKGQKFLHNSLKKDLLHWSAHSMGVFLASSDWDKNVNLSRYLSAIAVLESEISYRAFHPPFVQYLFQKRSNNLQREYKYLLRFLEGVFAHRISRTKTTESDSENNISDVLQTLVYMKNEWGNKNAIEEMISLVAGGTDAVSYTVSQALVLLSRNPKVQDKAYSLLSNNDIPLEREFHPYIKHIIHETMRLHPAVPFSSKYIKETSTDDFGAIIPGRTNLMWMKTAIGKNKDIFKNPDLFYPERYEKTKEGTKAETILNSLQFGTGIRHCIGHHLGEYLCFSFLTEIIKNFELVPIENVNVQFKATVSISPSSVPVRLIYRNAEAIIDPIRYSKQKETP